MNRQEAAEYFARKRDTLIWGLKDNRDETRQAHDAYNEAIAALCGPRPDPITGLVPCGCGGKANIWPSDLRQDMVTAYQVGCIECAMTTVWVRGKQEHAVKVWNRAMGYTPSGAIGPEQDGTAPNGDKGAGE